MADGGTANDLDAMHQLLHIKLKWKLTERELEHIERVFAMFDVPAVGSIDRRAFPYAMRRLRFADKSKRSKTGGSWASKRVVREVLNGTYPPFASANSELSYLAYVDAVGRAKDEIMHGDDQALNLAANGKEGPSAGALAQFGFSGFGLPGFEDEAPAPPPLDTSEYGSFGDETDVWSKSVESLGKGALAQAATLFTQALNSGTTKVHGDQRITRRDLSPVLQAVRPGLSEADVSQLCDLAGVTGRHGVTFVDVVLMCGYMELAATTLGGLPQVVRNHAAHTRARAAAVVAAQNAAAAAERNPPRPPAGLLGSLGSLAVQGGAMAAQGGAATFAAASGAASTVPGAQGAVRSLDSAANDFFGGAFTQASQAVGSAGAGLSARTGISSAAAAEASSYLQSSADVMFSVEDALAKAQTMAGQVAAGATTSGSLSGGGKGAYENKRVAAKRARLEKERAAATAAAAEAARSEGPAAMARAAAAAAMGPLYQKQTIGNWFKAKAGTGQVTWKENLKLVFNHVDIDQDGLINLGAFNNLVDDLELDLSEDESWARFCEVDVDNSGEISFDEFERFFETLIMEWRATEDDPSIKIQDQYRPLITLYEPDLGVFGNNADGKRKGFLLLMQRNGFVFWSDKDVNEARAAGHWSSRLGYDDAREAFELAAAYQAGGAQPLPGSSSTSVGARLSRLATLRFVRAMAPEGLALSDTDFERLVWAPHVRGYGGNPTGAAVSGASVAAIDSENMEMDLASFRRFVNDSALPRFFQQTLRNQREAAASKGKNKEKKAVAGANSGGGGGFFGSIFGGSNGNNDGGAGGSEEAGEEEWRAAFTAVDLDGSGDLDIEEVTLLLHGELNMDLTEDEIHALFMKHDTHLTEALDVDAFVKLVRDANALVAQTKEARDAEFLGWGRFGAGEDDKATVAARNQRMAVKKKAKEELAARGGRERSRKLKHDDENHNTTNGNPGGGGSKLKGDGRHLRRMPSRSQYSFKKAASFNDGDDNNDDGDDDGFEGAGGNVDAAALAQLKREVSHKLKHDDYAALTPTDIKDLQHNKGRKLEGLDAPHLERIPDPTPAGITQFDQGGYQTEDDEDEDDDDSDFEHFNADNMLAREQSRKLASDASEAAANALEATKLNLIGGTASNKKAYADIEADLDPDLMAELKTIFQQCLKDTNAHGLDQDGFVAAMQQLRLDLPEWKVRETFEEFDADGSGDLDFEEFVELAAMKLVEKWTAKGGKAFLQDTDGGGGAGNTNSKSAQANQLKTNARRALTVGEIMNEVMDNKKNEAYQRAKARFHVEEILLIEEAFVSFAEPRSRRGRCKITQLGPLCLCMGMNPRDRDVAVLAAEMDPLDTRVFELSALVEALAKYQNIWRKVDGQLADFRADQEVLDDAVAMACGRIFRKALRPAKTAASGNGVPLMEAKLLPAAFRLLGFVLEPDMASLWVMELVMGHDEAQEAADAEDAAALWEDEAHAALEARRLKAPAGSNPDDYQLDEEPPEIAAQREVMKAAAKARRWICLGDLLNVAGRYLHDTVEVVKEVTTTNTVAGVAMTSTEYVTEVVPRARTNAQEEAIVSVEDRSHQRAASYLLPYDTVQMAAALFEAMDKESAGRVAAYQLKLMFRRLSWRIGVKPSANQIDTLAASVGYPTGSTQTLSLYDWLFMVEWLGSHKKENNFLGQFGRAIAGFGYIDEGHFEDEEEHWEKMPEFGYTDTMASMRVQGVETSTGKEKVKVRSARAPGSRKESFRLSRESNVLGSTSGGSFRQSVDGENLNEGWGDEQEGQPEGEKTAAGSGSDDADAKFTEQVEAVYTLKKLVARAGEWSPEDEQRVQDLILDVQPSREVEGLINKGVEMTPSEQNQVQDLLQEMADSLEAQRPTNVGAEGENANLSDRELSKAAGIVSGIYADTKVKLGAKQAAEKFAKDEAENAWKAQAYATNDHNGNGQEEEEEKGGQDEAEAEAQRQEDEEEPSADSMAQALARAEEARQLRAAETASDREAASLFASHADDDGFLRGQPVLVGCLQKCGVNPSKDLRHALLVDGFVQALLALPQNSRLQGSNGNGNVMVEGAENKVLVTRDQFLRLLEQARRFSPRQKRVTRNDLEPEELFLLSDPLGYGFVTMKRVRRIVSAMGLSGRRDARVAEQLVRLGQESAEDHYVVTYDRFIVFIERVRGELQGLGMAAVLDVDLSNEARKAQKAVRQTRASIHESARHEMEKSGKVLSAEARALLAGGGRAAAKAAKAAADAQASAESGTVSDKDYMQSLQTLLDATEDWESKPPAERERTLHLLRVHALEVDKRRKVSSGAVLALEHRIDHLHDRAMRQTAYAKEFAISKLQADAAGVPPTPRAPPRPKEPPLTARVMNTLAAKEQAAADAQARSVAQDKAAAEFRAMNGVPAEPTAPVPSASVFDKKGYLKELYARAEQARKEFDAMAKVWLADAEEQASGNHHGPAREELELAAKRAIRLYVQVGALEPIPSAPTFQIGLIHKRLGNLHDAVECFDNVIDVDPTARCADTAAAWDWKGQLLLQLGHKPQDAAYCYSQAVALRPTDPIFKKHLRDAEAGFTTMDPEASSGDKKKNKKKDKKKSKAQDGHSTTL